MQRIDGAAQHVLHRLEENGYRACLVGGCVRDLLLGRPVHDWDIATSARPERVQEIFEKTIPTGIKHGTVTVMMDGKSFEVTTFRSDGVYLDGRRPEQVSYVTQLEEDLSRRDFTINAMAMEADGQVTDLFGGREDLSNKVIRCVGEAETRFSEDALRMLRAVRFSAQLGFAIEEKTQKAIALCASLCAKLSAERVRDEMEKTLCSPRPEMLGAMIELGLLSSFGLQGKFDLQDLGKVPCERLARWTQAKHMLPEMDLSLLRLEKRAVRLCTAAAACCAQMHTRLDCKRVIARQGWEAAELAAQLCGKEDAVEEIKASGECVSLAQLVLKGGDLPQLSGPEIASALNRALEYVLLHPEENELERLKELLKRSAI